MKSVYLNKLVCDLYHALQPRVAIQTRYQLQNKENSYSHPGYGHLMSCFIKWQ